MLSQVGRHGLIDLAITTEGDLHVDAHHVVEDTAIVLGQALRQALGDKEGIAGSATRRPAGRDARAGGRRPRRTSLLRAHRRAGGSMSTR